MEGAFFGFGVSTVVSAVGRVYNDSCKIQSDEKVSMADLQIKREVSMADLQIKKNRKKVTIKRKIENGQVVEEEVTVEYTGDDDCRDDRYLQNVQERALMYHGGRSIGPPYYGQHWLNDAREVIHL